jgi:hypothetical protein
MTSFVFEDMTIADATWKLLDQTDNSMGLYLNQLVRADLSARGML